MNDDDEGGDEGSGDVVKVVMKVILSWLRGFASWQTDRLINEWTNGHWWL